ncbi:N-acetylmuramoyl-L-alanine amidase [Enterococcus florum]|uniref:N-acetylmuramoyl-L-alanine amidase n=1 Tax=Enterococcus florum TaxID=2480627 RepID=A0A4P5PF78_9ENTE|nr:N-acetylmuramoyl-L-alanine amidase [Enterococcus florum]
MNDVELDESFLVSEVAESDLNSFELPLLQSFEDKNRALLIYEGIKQVGAEKVLDKESDEKEKQDITNVEELIDYLTYQLFDQSYDQVKQQEVAFEEKQPGDLLYQEGKLIGMYLGDEYYLNVEEQQVFVEDFSELKEEKLSAKQMTDLTPTDYGKTVEKAYPASMDYRANEQTQAFIDKISDQAQELGLKYDVFASVMIAQAILESASGTSGLSVAPHYNLFGIKGSFQGSSVSMSTQEDRGSGDMYTTTSAFRSYPSYGESLGDYVTLLRGGVQGNDDFYTGAWRSKAKNYLRAADFLTGKYATDSSYNRKLSSLIAVYHLTEYDIPRSVTGTGTETSAILQGKENIPEVYRKAMKYPDYNGKNYNTSGSYPVGQCTWYAFNRVAQLGKRVDDFMGNGGEWGTKGRSLGYKVSSTPKAGWLISFSPGTAGSDPRYGHVAFVEAVGPDGILISEGNVVGGTTISYRVIGNELAKSNLVSYIEPK